MRQYQYKFRNSTPGVELWCGVSLNFSRETLEAQRKNREMTVGTLTEFSKRIRGERKEDTPQ